MSKTILIVEDEKNISEVYRDVLEENNYKTITAETGTEALKIIEEKMPDLIILDIKLPDVTGTEILAQVRAYNTSVPIIVSTAVSSEKLKTSLDRWANMVITKPVDMKFLLEKIKGFLAKTS